MRVLIVDDHLLFRQGLASLLSSEADFEVCGQAGTVAEAIDQARRMQPEIILMDFGLPDGSGADATKIILAEHPDCKVLFLTVHSSDIELFAAIRSGATGFLLKNEPIEKLLEALRTVYHGEIAVSMDMTRRIFKEFSQRDSENHGSQGALSSLTQREIEVLRQMINDASNHEIATTFFLSENTVKRHVHSILIKLGVSSRREAAKVAREFGLK